MPGSFVGSRTIALTTSDLGRTSYAPGFRVEGGVRTEDGWTFSASYLHTFRQTAHATATLIPPGFQNQGNLADSFVSSPVFNFPTQFAGPARKTAVDGQTVNLVQASQGIFPAPVTLNNSAYGIWNGATVQTIAFRQQFDNMDLTVRCPVYESEYARSYAKGGFRHSWIFERFTWYTVSESTDPANPDRATRRRLVQEHALATHVWPVPRHRTGHRSR